MLIVSIDELKPGSKLAVGVMHPRQREQELLKAGFVVDQNMIGRLKSLEVTQVFVDFPGLEDLDAVLLPALSPERRAVYDQVKAAITANEKATRPVVRFGAYHEVTRTFVKTMLASPANAMLLDILGSGGDSIEHATTVAHLALVLALRLEAYLIRERPRLSSVHAKDVTSLGVAAMLHDIGKTKLPKELRDFHALNPPPETHRPEWESHAELGFELIRHDVDAATAATVLHHHQQYDGNGFPVLIRSEGKAALAGSQIHIFARVLRAADLFERLATRPDGSRRTNYETLHLLRVHFQKQIDPEVLVTMPQVIPPFGPGRRVTLSDGSHAIVTGFNALTPYQPSVRRLAIGAQSASDAVDLRTTPELTITHIDGQSLAELDAAPLPLAA